MSLHQFMDMTSTEIFSSLNLSIEYCKWLGKGWSVYRVPGRAEFTVSKTKDMWSDTRVSYSHGPQRHAFDPRWVVFST